MTLSKEQEGLILALHATGMPMSRIAEAVHCSRSTVANYVDPAQREATRRLQRAGNTVDAEGISGSGQASMWMHRAMAASQPG